uniref:ATP synthase subunit a n=1 Tax=Ruizia karukerae TaxID=2201929 RepID=A0A343YNA5_9BILA|nr:ATP synthase F0 subunit 6 [Ruizia karukerae]
MIFSFLEVLLFYYWLQFVIVNEQWVKCMSFIFRWILKYVGIEGFLSEILYIWLILIMVYSAVFGYLPYSYSVFSFFEFTFFFASVFWMSTFFVYFYSEKFSLRMTESKYTYVGSLLLVLIEILSEFSRPFSLAFRLTVNVALGHVMVNVIFGSVLFSLSGVIYLLLLMLLEMIVYVVQIFIFTRLMIFYLGE